MRSISLWGHVLDSFTKAGVSAKITLMDGDSIVLDSTMCENKGNDAVYRFFVPRVAGHYIIKAEHKDFVTEYVSYRINRIARNNYFDAPWHYMKRKDKVVVDKEMALGEVVVKATKIRMTHKGDTIVFNADAFNVPDGSMLSSLIKQLPNTEINADGEIFVNGRKIDELMLNGDSFYKGNNKVMLDNLPYYVVKDIRVFEKSTERSTWAGRDMEKRDYVMNVQMKKEYIGRLFGNAEGTGGTRDRYLGRLFLMNVTNHSRLIAFGNLNNINNFRRPGEDGIWDDGANADGIIERKDIHVSYLYNDKEKRFSENLESALLMQDNNEESFAFVRNYQTDGSNYKLFKNIVIRKNVNWSVANTFKMQHPFKPYRFSSFLKLDYSNHKNANHAKGATMEDDPSLLGVVSDVLDSIMTSPSIVQADKCVTYRSLNDFTDKHKDLTLKGNMDYSRKLKNGDNISFAMDAHYTGMKPYESFNYISKETSTDKVDENRNRYVNKAQKEYAYHAKMTYSIVLYGWTCKPSFSYNQSYSNRQNLNYRLDWLHNGWDEIGGHEFESLPSTDDSLMLTFDDGNSYRYHLLNRDYKGNLSFYKYVKRGDLSDENDLSVSIHHEHDKMTYYGHVLDTTALRSKWLFNANYRYERVWEHSDKTFTLSMEYKSSQPDFTMLVGEVDTSDPTNFDYKNGTLKGLCFCNMDLRFVTRKKPINQSMYVIGHVNMKRNSITNKTVYDAKKGVYHYIPMNVNGNWRADVSYRLYRDVDKAKHFYVSSSTTLSYIRDVGYAMAQDWESCMLSMVNTWKLDKRLSLTYTLGKFSTSLKGRIDWRYSTGNLQAFQTLNRVKYNYGVNVVYTTPLGVKLSTDAMMTTRRGYEDSAMNNDDCIWHASLSSSIGRKKNVTVILDAYDILHGVETRYELFDGGSKMEVWLNNIPSYYMGHILVKF